jgi:hypothetical protein
MNPRPVPTSINPGKNLFQNFICADFTWLLSITQAKLLDRFVKAVQAQVWPSNEIEGR